jgi:hypothetical protein
MLKSDNIIMLQFIFQPKHEAYLVEDFDQDKIGRKKFLPKQKVMFYKVVRRDLRDNYVEHEKISTNGPNFEKKFWHTIFSMCVP